MARVLFIAHDSDVGHALWVTDGTRAGTQRVADISPNEMWADPAVLGHVDGVGTLLAGYDDVAGAELWITDGTSAGTSLLKDINPGTASSLPQFVYALDNGLALFSAVDGIHGRELWATDGTAAGTVLLKDINASGSSHPAGHTLLASGLLLFSASVDGVGRSLWATDGTAAGTVELYPFDFVSGEMIRLDDGRALFSAGIWAQGEELWVTDGTVGGTQLVKDLYPGEWMPGEGKGSSPQGFAALGNGSVLFAATDAEGFNGLWVSDGTGAGTTPVARFDFYNPVDLEPIWVPTEIVALGNGKALFAADTVGGSAGMELWSSDGTVAGTVRIKDIWSGASGSNPHMITALGDGRALFFANDGDLLHGRELWVSDGTAAGTAMVRDIVPGSASSAQSGVVPDAIFSLGDGRALLRVAGAGSGMELWISDGTEAGTFLLSDINPGNADSYPVQFILLPNQAPKLTGTAATLAAGSEDSAYVIAQSDLLAGYSDIDGDTLGVSNLAASHGGITSNGDGTFTLAPPSNYNGTVTLAYNVVDGQGGSVAASQSLLLANTPENGTAGADAMNSAAGGDSLYGLAGNDTLTGSASADFLAGGNGRDSLVGSEGNDTLDGGGQADTLRGGDGADVLYGGAANDWLYGHAGNDSAWGGDGADVISGGTGADDLRGEDGNDTLLGDADADTLNGGTGVDSLTGGGGADVFRFANPFASGADVISDFASGSDAIHINKGLVGISQSGVLASGRFVLGSDALDDTDRLVFDGNTGSLYYDADGNGVIAKVLVATLQGVTAMTAADIVLV